MNGLYHWNKECVCIFGRIWQNSWRSWTFMQKNNLVMSLSGLTSAPDPLWADPGPDHQPSRFCTSSPLPALHSDPDTWHFYTFYQLPRLSLACMYIPLSGTLSSFLMTWRIPAEPSGLGLDVTSVKKSFLTLAAESHALPHCLQGVLQPSSLHWAQGRETAPLAACVACWKGAGWGRGLCPVHPSVTYSAVLLRSYLSARHCSRRQE